MVREMTMLRRLALLLACLALPGLAEAQPSNGCGIGYWTANNSPYTLGSEQSGICHFAATTACGTLCDDLFSYWNLNEESGTRVDVVGSNNFTDVNTVGFTTGKASNAASFVTLNSEEFTSATENLGYVLTSGSFTLSAWVKTSATSGGIAGKWWVGFGAYAYYIVHIPAASKPNFDVLCNDVGDTVKSVTASNGPAINDNQWHLVVAWYDATNQLIGISVDNSTPNTTPNTLGVNQDTPADPLALFRVGGIRPEGVTLDGSIDEVGMWSRALTADEIAELYNAGTGKFYNGFTFN